MADAALGMRELRSARMLSPSYREGWRGTDSSEQRTPHLRVTPQPSAGWLLPCGAGERCREAGGPVQTRAPLHTHAVAGSAEGLARKCHGGLISGRNCWPSPRRSAPYFASHPVRAELPEAEGGLNPPEQCHNVQVFDPSPEEDSTVRVASLPRGDLLICPQGAGITEKYHRDLPGPTLPLPVARA